MRSRRTMQRQRLFHTSMTSRGHQHRLDLRIQVASGVFLSRDWTVYRSLPRCHRRSEFRFLLRDSPLTLLFLGLLFIFSSTRQDDLAGATLAVSCIYFAYPARRWPMAMSMKENAGKSDTFRRLSVHTRARLLSLTFYQSLNIFYYLARCAINAKVACTLCMHTAVITVYWPIKDDYSRLVIV